MDSKDIFFDNISFSRLD